MAKVTSSIIRTLMFHMNRGTLTMPRTPMFTVDASSRMPKSQSCISSMPLFLTDLLGHYIVICWYWFRRIQKRFLTVNTHACEFGHFLASHSLASSTIISEERFGRGIHNWALLLVLGAAGHRWYLIIRYFRDIYALYLMSRKILTKKQMPALNFSA